MKNKLKANGFVRTVCQIKKRPGAFLGHFSIRDFCTFLDGYSFARVVLDAPTTDQELEFSGFQDWIAKKYDTVTCHSWASIILLNSEDDKTAFWKFFELFDEYQEFVRSQD